MSKVYLSLGSNIEDRVSNIQQAVRLLNLDNQINILKSSTFYETQPWGGKTEDWFVNVVVLIETDFLPVEFLRICQNIEEKMGRNRDTEQRWGNRIIDIDILFYDDIVFDNHFLKIPHPLLHKRGFVLVPMLEIASDFVHPIFKKTISDLFDELENPESVFLYGTILGGKDYDM